MTTVLIISVGGTIEPIVTSLLRHRPQLVVFFASEQTIEKIGEIRTRLGEQGLTIPDRKIMVPNAEDLIECYQYALKCAELAQEKGCPSSEIVVDYTGGTKAMTAALTLATVGKGFSFSYIGGHQRSKDGCGIVVTGSEAIIHRADPFEIFAVEDRQRLAIYFATYQFTAAQELLSRLLERPLPEPEHLAFTTLRELAQGYEAWDRFVYQQAITLLKPTLKKWAAAVQANPSILYAHILPHLRNHVAWLEKIQTATGQFHRYDRVLIDDMLANAGRRAQEGKFDDAVIRVYRALELGGQAGIQRTLGCGTDRVPVDRIPPSLLDDFRERFEKQPGFLELPLAATYNMLAKLGEPEGQRFLERYQDFQKIQHARNHSWLAHGKTPCTQETYDTLRLLAEDILARRPSITFLTLTC